MRYDFFNRDNRYLLPNVDFATRNPKAVFLKTIDTLEAETRAKGQGGMPFRSAREAADEISTPYFGDGYDFTN